MKVSYTPDITGSLPRQATANAFRSTGTGNSAPEASDKLAIVGTEKLVRATTADIRPDKVAMAKAAIESGAFKINPEAIANRLIKETQSMIETLGARPDQSTALTPQDQYGQENNSVEPNRRLASSSYQN